MSNKKIHGRIRNIVLTVCQLIFIHWPIQNANSNAYAKNDPPISDNEQRGVAVSTAVRKTTEMISKRQLLDTSA